MTDKATILEFLQFKINNKELYEKLSTDCIQNALLVGVTQGAEAEKEYWANLEEQLLDPQMIESLQRYLGVQLFAPTIH